MFKMTSATSSGSPRHRFSKKRWALAGLVIIVAVVAVLELTNTTHFFHKPPTEVIVKAGKQSPAPKKNVSASTPPATKNPTNNSARNISGATDTSGATNAQTSSSQWTVAASGNITVKQPIANAKLQSGDTLSGSAKLDHVNFRLIDNQVGVISQGTLSVVNGNFSGNINFTPHASSGRLDVFSTDSKGVELNEVQISVSF